MEAILKAEWPSIPQCMSFAPRLFFCSSIIAYFADLLLSTRPNTDDDPYEPLPRTKWVYQQNPKLRSIEEPPPTDEMREEEALFQAQQGPWPSWYVEWDYQNNTWNWGAGWRRKGLPPVSKREPTGDGQRWYWQEDPKDRKADEPLANEQMLEEERLALAKRAPWPLWYRRSQKAQSQENVEAADPIWVWERQWYRERIPNMPNPPSSPAFLEEPTDDSTALKTVSSFLLVYFLVMMADWMQGPYVYAVLRELKIPEHKITMLFGADSVAAALTGKFIGWFTDGLGRKRACLMFCVLYTLNSCSMILSSCWSVNMAVLIAGRLFRGIATNLLYSAFESWFIATYESLRLRKLGINIGRIFGYLTVIKGTSAFLAGILSEEIVHLSGYKTYTMIASAALFVIACLVIAFSWEENYGTHKSFVSIPDAFQNPELRALNLVSIVFNISLDVFTLLWARTLEDAAPKMVLLSYPNIYSTFLFCTIFGAFISNISVSTRKLLSHSNALSAAMLVGAACLAVPFFAGSNFALSFIVLCIFRICTGMISPAICQLKYNIVPNPSRAEIYTIFHLPFFQWSHWMNYALIFIFGPHPDDVAERVLLYLSILMAAVALRWYVVSNSYQARIDQAPIDPEVPTPAPTTALSSVKEKIYRLSRVLKDGYSAAENMLSSLWHRLLDVPPIIGTLIIIATVAAFYVIMDAVKWTIRIPMGIWQWIFGGGNFPDLTVSPPSSPFHPPVPPPFQEEDEGDETQGGNFKKFWNSSGKAAKYYLFVAVVSVIMWYTAWPLLKTIDLVFTTNLADYCNSVVQTSISSTLSLAQVLLELGGFWGAWTYFKTIHQLSYLSMTALDLFTTCTSAFFTAVDTIFSLRFGIYPRLHNAYFLLRNLFPDFSYLAVEPVAWAIDFFIPEDTFLAEISDTLRNAATSFGTNLYEAATDFVDYVVETYHFNSARLLSIAESLIPGGRQNSVLVGTTEGVKNFVDVGSTILLKKYGWQETFFDNLTFIFAGLILLVVIGFIMPWEHLWGATVAVSEFGLRTVQGTWGFISSITLSAGKLIISVISRIWEGIQTIVTAPFRWLYSNVPRIYRRLPAPLRLILDPVKFGVAFLYDQLRKCVGVLLWITGYLMIEIDQFISYGVWRIWNSIKAAGRFIVRLLVAACKALEKSARLICRLWMRSARWLENTGKQLWG